MITAIVIMSLVITILVLLSYTWYVSFAAVLYFYIEKKGGKEPSKNEWKECIRWARKNAHKVKMKNEI